MLTLDTQITLTYVWKQLNSILDIHLNKVLLKTNMTNYFLFRLSLNLTKLISPLRYLSGGRHSTHKRLILQLFYRKRF